MFNNSQLQKKNIDLLSENQEIMVLSNQVRC